MERGGLLEGWLGAQAEPKATMGYAGGWGTSMGRSSRSPHSFHDPM